MVLSDVEYWCGHISYMSGWHNIDGIQAKGILVKIFIEALFNLLYVKSKLSMYLILNKVQINVYVK